MPHAREDPEEILAAFRLRVWAASVEYTRQVSAPPWPTNAPPKAAFALFSSSSAGGRRRSGADSDADDEDGIPPDWRSLYSPRLDVEPSVKDPRDEATSDAWVKRHPALVRLTGKHPFNSEPPLPRLMSHGFITPVPLHYVRNHGAVPKADWSTWTVEVTGLVKRPVRLTMEELVTGFQAVEFPVTLVCAGNRRKEQNMVRQSSGFNWGPGAVSTTVWRGVRLRDVLRRCGVMGAGVASNPECMINELNINSVITTPGHDEVLPINALTTQKPYTMKGYAYSGGGRKVTRVEVTLDGGETWQVCELDHPERPTKYGKYWCWCFWSVDVEVLDLLGAKEIAVRAWDEALNTQPERLIWNLMGMMNNCWFRVKININVCRPHKGEIGLVFDHPTQPGNQSGGWMARQKHIETSETTQGTLKRSTSTPFMSTASAQYTMSEVRCRLVDKKSMSDNVRLFRFALPSPDQKLGLPVGKHVYVCASTGGKLCMRAYTPTSSVEEVGHVDLLIKIYFKDEDPKFPAGGLMSQYLDSLPLGAPVDIKGPVGHIEYAGRGAFTVGGERRFARRLAMVAGGTGITPVYQVIQAVLRDQPDDTTEMHLVFANRTEDDMLLREEIDRWAAAHPARLKVWYVVSKVARPEDAWEYGVGRVDEQVLREHLPLGGDGETLALVCGPPAMLECTVRPGLEKMGYDLDKDCLVF
uniref:Nitrate reductase (NAD(P)H) n=1 Tax=Aegilops tauschii TaxID=37682 RepID=N1QTS7_AEGTA